MTNTLTPRDLTILRFAAQGYTNLEIGKVLGLSEKSIEHMMGTADAFRAIYPKIGVKNRAEAVAWYTAQFGWTEGTAHHSKTADHLVELATDYVTRVHQVRMSGNPRMAIEMAQYITRFLEEAAHEPFSPGSRQMLLTLRAKALLEQGTTYLEIVLPHQAVGLTHPVFNAIRDIAKEINDSRTLGTAYMVIAGACNIHKQYNLGRQFYQKAYTLVDTTDFKLRVLRGRAIAAAYSPVPDLSEVHKVASESKSFIESGNFSSWDQVCETTEGMGKALGVAGSAKAYSHFEEAEKILAAYCVQSDIKSPPLRLLQLTTSKLEALYHLEPTHTTSIERLGQEGLRLSQEYGYPRHARVIEQLLAEALN